MLQTLEELWEDDEKLCKYCSRTDYGECKELVTPRGDYICCEGTWCKEHTKE